MQCLMANVLSERSRKQQCDHCNGIQQPYNAGMLRIAHLDICSPGR